MDKEDRDQYTAHHHVSHFSYNRVLNNETNGMPVDIGTGIDWTDMTFTEDHSIIEEGEEWVTTTREYQEEAMQKQALSVKNLVTPTQKDGTPYSVKGSP